MNIPHFPPRLGLTEITADEVRPRVTERFAVMKTSVFSLSSPTVRFRILVTMTIPGTAVRCRCQNRRELMFALTEGNYQSDDDNNHIANRLREWRCKGIASRAISGQYLDRHLSGSRVVGVSMQKSACAAQHHVLDPLKYPPTTQPSDQASRIIPSLPSYRLNARIYHPIQAPGGKKIGVLACRTIRRANATFFVI